MCVKIIKEYFISSKDNFYHFCLTLSHCINYKTFLKMKTKSFTSVDLLFFNIQRKNSL